MKLHHLITRPQQAIVALVERGGVIAPIAGYFLLAFAHTPDGMFRFLPELGLSRVGFVLMGTLIMAAAFVVIYGLGTHAGARILGGRPGFGYTILAIGYAIFWPAVIGALATIADGLLTANGAERLAVIPETVKTIASVWGIYLVIAAVHAWHRLSWVRAVVAPLMVMVVLGGLIVALEVAR